ncbi:unnamed protein product [Kuraishia capsulata CBS 1993]|uniref:Ribosome biogenesis protein ALB1 n=1 Tax=Kuraishia capsulata CBS 1993 TaxID=1382522 RepID=W6MMH6_9ASCO|nr:uncharacterized protein KUCA_T00003773001 [Kuraishia capsulata CBS 1993]CDK27794.1 unnamed protein product [Kuraishia capsulata CBS 1993]
MPSRNSVNRPKDGILRRKKAVGLARKRAAKRSSAPTGRFRGPASLVGTAKSSAVALYTGVSQPTGLLTTQTLSNKRRKKLERNQIYVDRRKGAADKPKEDDTTMDVDEMVQKKEQQAKSIREALWSVIEQGRSVPVINGTEGTTLGGPSY